METDLPNPLLQLLSNSLILYQTTPYLPIHSLLALGAASKTLQYLVHQTPGVFRHLDLAHLKSAQFHLAAIDRGGEVWRNVQLDENVTFDDFYAGPLRGIFNSLRRKDILSNVQTLILDGLSVTSELVTEIICEGTFNVRMLSIREVQNLNERKLQSALRYAIRPTRAESTPRLEALYIFGPKDAEPGPRSRRHVNKYPPGVAPIDTLPSHYLQGAQPGPRWDYLSEDAIANDIQRSGDKWYHKSGKVLANPLSLEWANTVLACRGIISFDAVLCKGPRHSPSITTEDDQKFVSWYRKQGTYLSPRIATYALGGCCKCTTAPESFSQFGRSPIEDFPLLAPPPLHASNLKAAKTPTTEDSVDRKLLVRCIDCIRNRYCESCQQWWCEDCYEIPTPAFQSAAFLKPWESINAISDSLEENVKVHMGPCVETCHVAEIESVGAMECGVELDPTSL